MSKDMQFGVRNDNDNTFQDGNRSRGVYNLTHTIEAAPFTISIDEGATVGASYGYQSLRLRQEKVVRICLEDPEFVMRYFKLEDSMRYCLDAREKILLYLKCAVVSPIQVMRWNQMVDEYLLAKPTSQYVIDG